ncbi:MAG: glycosyltransferase family 4 protein [Chloroflexi bacterium]|nr:glycosyltransferase family 4 protein [Chloroflexota bacterium]
MKITAPTSNLLLLTARHRDGHQTDIKRPQRILYVPILFFPDAWNGIMEHLRLLLSGLDRTAFEPLVAVRPGDGPQTLRLAGLTSSRPLTMPKHYSTLQFAALCRHERIALIHVHTSSVGGVAKLAVGAQLGGVRCLMVTYHLVQVRRLGLCTRLVNQLAHRLLLCRTVAVSRAVSGSLIHAGAVALHRMTVIYNGVEDLEEQVSQAQVVKREDPTVQVGYFGRLAKEKGVRHLLEAIAQASQRYGALRALIVGDGYQRQELEQLVLTLGLSERVQFVGHRDDARQLMRKVDIIVLPSLVEGFSVVLVEAMESGKPVIASRIPGVADEAVVEGVTGLLTDPGKSDQLASALVRLAEAPELRAAMGAQARERFRRYFHSRVMVQKLDHEYRSLLGLQPIGRRGALS